MSNEDVHVTPVNDLREHTERRDCWCEPELEWPCLVCFKAYIEDNGAFGMEGKLIGHEHGEPDRNDCPVCGGTGVVTRPNHLRCMVIHDAKDGRPSSA